MNKKVCIFLMVAALLLGTAIRVVHYKWDMYDSDEAIVGLMAMHILSGENFPVFNYGYPKLGSLEAYVTAVMFKLFGVSILSHRLAILIFAVIYSLAMYFLSVRLFKSKKIGLLTLCFTLVCPSFLCFWNFAARAVYIESLCLGTLIFILVHQIIWGNEKRPVFFLMLGLLGGLSWWTGGLVLYYILTAAIFFFMKDKLILFRRRFWILVCGFFVGSSPFWIHQLRTGFESMLFYSPEQSKFSIHVLTGFVKYGLPFVLSIGPCTIPEGFLCKLSFAMEAVFFAALLGLAWAYRSGLFSMMKFSISGTKGPELIFCFVIVVTLIFSFSRYAGGNYRVLLPLYTAIPMLFAFLIISLEKRTKFAAYLAAGIVVFFSLYSTLCYSVEAFRQGESRRDRQGLPPVGEFVQYLMDIEVKRCYADGNLALKMAIASKGEIVCAGPHNWRYLPYEEIVNAEPKPIYIIRQRGANRFTKILMSLCSFDTEQWGEFAIFRNFERPRENLVELSPEKWKATASRNVSSAGFACDRNIFTKWDPGRSQRAGEYFELDLGEICKLRKLIIIIDSFGKRNHLEKIEFPLGFDLELSQDGKTWKKVFHLPEYGAVGSLFWSDCRPFWKAFDGRMELFLPEVIETRYIKLILTNDHHVHKWTIDEIFVYSAGENEGDRKDSHEAVLDFLMKQEIEKVYADYWLSSWIHFASKEKIEYIPPYSPSRYPVWYEADRLVDFAQDTAFIVEGENAPALEEILNLSGIIYSRKEIGKYLICYDLMPETDDKGVRLSTDNWSAVTSNSGTDARNAFDGDPATRWGTGAAQKPGMFYELDLGRSYILRKVNFSLGEFAHDYPRGYRIEVSADRESWERLEKEDGWREEFFWSATHLLKYHEPGIDFRCKPTSARFIRVSLTGHDDRFDWSVAEINVLGRKDRF